MVDPDLIDFTKENSQFGCDQDFAIGVEELKSSQDRFVRARRFDRIDVRSDTQLSLNSLLPLVDGLGMHDPVDDHCGWQCAQQQKSQSADDAFLIVAPHADFLVSSQAATTSVNSNARTAESERESGVLSRAANDENTRLFGVSSPCLGLAIKLYSVSIALSG